MSYKDTTAAAGTKYYYRVLASNSAGSSPASNIANATTLAANTVVVYVSDLTWSSATVGYGTIQKDKSINGQTIALRGAKYSKGIGTHAASTITYNIAGLYSSFISDVGIDDEVTGQGSVDFQVIGDGKTLFDSGKLTGASPVVHINVSVAGVKTLELVATNGISGSIDYDHADWAGAQLVGAPTTPTAPTNLVAAAVSSSEIDLNWTNTAVNQSGFEIDRSSSGTSFTLLKNVSATTTSYQDTGLSLGTKYYYRVEATNSLGASPSSNIVNATTLATTPVTTYLSSLTWASATTGYGTIQKDKSINGQTITLNGVTYTRGIGTHALSKIVYNLAGQYNSFVSDVGIDDEVGDEGSVDFQVVGDGKVLFDSGIMGGLSATQSLNINVTGVQQLTLVATNGIAGDIDFDHADWAGARLLGNSTVPSVPTNLIATPFSGSQINLSWTATSTNQTGFEIDRSTDGTNFTVVTTVASTTTSYSDIGRTAAAKYYYRVKAVNNLGSSQPSTVASATTLAANSTTTYLSDLTWTSATVGLRYHPERQEHQRRHDLAARHDVHQRHRHARELDDHLQPRRKVQNVQFRHRHRRRSQRPGLRHIPGHRRRQGAVHERHDHRLEPDHPHHQPQCRRREDPAIGGDDNDLGQHRFRPRRLGERAADDVTRRRGKIAGRLPGCHKGVISFEGTESSED